MTAIATVASGNWDVPFGTGGTPWSAAGSGPGGIPGAGDTITNGNIAHTVTIPAGVSAEIGVAGVFGTAVTISGGNGLTVPAFIINGTLKTYGTIAWGNRRIHGGAGGILEFDKGTHATAVTLAGTTNGAVNCKLMDAVANVPTPASPFIIQGATGQSNSGHCVTTGGFTNCAQCDITAIELKRLGNATTPAWLTGIVSSGDVMRVGRMITDSCYDLVACQSNIDTNCIYSFTNVTETNPLSNVTTGISLHIRSVSGASITGTRQLVHCRLRRNLKNYGIKLKLSDVVIDLGTGANNAIESSNATSSFSTIDNLVTRHGQATPMMLSPGDVINSAYALATGINTRWWGFSSGWDATAGDITVNNCITQRVGGDSDGDPFIKSSNPSAVQRYVFRNCLSLHNALNRLQDTGKIASPLANPSNERWNIEHCTWVTGGGGGETAINFGENQSVDVGTGVMESIKNNLAFSPTGAAGSEKWILRGILGTAGFFQTPILLAANCDYNGGFNLSTDGFGNPNGYRSQNNASNVGTGVGAHDVRADPQFRDPRLRDIGLWYADRMGISITGNEQACVDGAMAEMMKANDLTGYDSYFDPPNLFTYVFPGWAPTSAPYRGTASDGGTMGAVAWASTGRRIAGVLRPGR